MIIVNALLIYFLIWWMVFFCTLPLWIKRNTGEFQGSGAPESHNLKKKILLTSGISLLVWVFVFGAIRAGFLDFRSESMEIIKENTHES